jgi:ABC-type antimicrobial peptide transport system permease subunit
MLTLITLLFALLSAALLALAALNIAHTFYRTVAERRREIGILRAVGASARDVRRMLLIEAGAIGLGGGLLGLALARLLALGVDLAAHHFVPDSLFKPDSYFAFGWPIVTGALLCSVIASLGGAWWPARAASRLEPTEALLAP